VGGDATTKKSSAGRRTDGPTRCPAARGGPTKELFFFFFLHPGEGPTVRPAMGERRPCARSRGAWEGGGASWALIRGNRAPLPNRWGPVGHPRYWAFVRRDVLAVGGSVWPHHPRPTREKPFAVDGGLVAGASPLPPNHRPRDEAPRSRFWIRGGGGTPHGWGFSRRTGGCRFGGEKHSGPRNPRLRHRNTMSLHRDAPMGGFGPRRRPQPVRRGGLRLIRRGRGRKRGFTTKQKFAATRRFAPQGGVTHQTAPNHPDSVLPCWGPGGAKVGRQGLVLTLGQLEGGLRGARKTPPGRVGGVAGTRSSPPGHSKTGK